jgi:hypothetical protein
VIIDFHTHAFPDLVAERAMPRLAFGEERERMRFTENAMRLIDLR